MPTIRITDDIQPLTHFRNNSVMMARQLKETQRPIVLTINGRPEIVCQSVEAYQRLLDLAALADEKEAIRQAEEEFQQGLGRPAREFFAEFKKEPDLMRLNYHHVQKKI